MPGDESDQRSYRYTFEVDTYNIRDSRRKLEWWPAALPALIAAKSYNMLGVDG